jgi:hypothetical protein
VAHRLVRLLGGGVDGQRGIDLLHLAERHLLIGAVDRRGRRHQQVPDLQLARAFHHVECAGDVGVDVGAGMFEAVADPGLRGEVTIASGSALAGEFEQPLMVEDVEFLGAEGIALAQQRVPLLLQLEVVIGGHRVDADHPEAFGDQQPGKVEADEAGSSGNKDGAHGGQSSETNGL